jgi:hypothetical protein
MAFEGRDRNRIRGDRAHALGDPIRVAILDLFTKDGSRSLAADDLLADLTAENPNTCGKLHAGQVAYHRARLQDAELLPSGG